MTVLHRAVSLLFIQHTLPTTNPILIVREILLMKAPSLVKGHPAQITTILARFKAFVLDLLFLLKRFLRFGLPLVAFGVEEDYPLLVADFADRLKMELVL